MHKVIEAIPLDGFRLRLFFEDGREGTVELAGLVGKGVFSSWADPSVFAQVTVDPISGAPSWPGDIDLCPDSLYEDLFIPASAHSQYGIAERPLEDEER